MTTDSRGIGPWQCLAIYASVGLAAFLPVAAVDKPVPGIPYGRDVHLILALTTLGGLVLCAILHALALKFTERRARDLLLEFVGIELNAPRSAAADLKGCCAAMNSVPADEARAERFYPRLIEIYAIVGLAVHSVGVAYPGTSIGRKLQGAAAAVLFSAGCAILVQTISFARARARHIQESHSNWLIEWLERRQTSSLVSTSL